MIEREASMLNSEDRWRKAAEWVEENKQKILGWARPKMKASGYEEDDFIQEAYLAAYQALEVVERKGDPKLFERCFWVLYKFKRAGALLNGASRFAKGRDDFPDLAASAENETESANGNQIDDIITESLSAMTPKERKVWNYLLGRNGGALQITEIAEKMGVTPRRVLQIRKSGLRRAREYFVKNNGNVGIHDEP